jgi:hypothetical protein
MPSLYLFDTNTVSAVMADHPKVKARLSPLVGSVVTCAIVRGEVGYGLERLPAGNAGRIWKPRQPRSSPHWPSSPFLQQQRTFTGQSAGLLS